MPAYAKIWTSIWNNEQFLSLRHGERGLFLQSIVWCKLVDDLGSVRFKSVAHLGSVWGCDRKTAGNLLRKIHETSLWVVTENNDGSILIEIPNYDKWQELTVDKLRSTSGKSRGKVGEKSHPLRAEQSRAKQSKAEQSIDVAEKPATSRKPANSQNQNSPILRFRNWIELNQFKINKYCIKATDISFKLEPALSGKKWVESHIGDMERAIILNSDKYESYDNFGGFVHLWLRNAYDAKEVGHFGLKSNLSADEEREYYRNKEQAARSRTSSNFKPLID